MAWVLKTYVAKKARTFLTIFGVIISATSIILMVSIGLGEERRMYKMFDTFGSVKNIRVMPGRGGAISVVV